MLPLPSAFSSLFYLLLSVNFTIQSRFLPLILKWQCCVSLCLATLTWFQCQLHHLFLPLCCSLSACTVSTLAWGTGTAFQSFRLFLFSSFWSASTRVQIWWQTWKQSLTGTELFRALRTLMELGGRTRSTLSRRQFISIESREKTRRIDLSP